jgi:hypothetical protein
VAGWLDAARVDLIEISGGTYEQPKMANINGVEPVFDPFTSKSTREREAFFAQFAPEMRRHVKRAKLMVTGGFRTAQGMADAIANDGVDLIGLGRPLCLYPDAPASLLNGTLSRFVPWEHRLRIGPGLLGPHSPITIIKAINGFGSMTWFNEQLRCVETRRVSHRNTKSTPTAPGGSGTSDPGGGHRFLSPPRI